MVPRFFKRIYLISVILYIVLGFVFAFVGQAYGLGTYQRIGPRFYGAPTTTVPTGSNDAQVERYYDYLQLRHLYQQTETFQVNVQALVITYGILGAGLLLAASFVFMWYTKSHRNQAGLYPVEVYNHMIAERNAPVDIFTWCNYAVLLAFMVFYIWWNLTYGQWY